MIAVSYRSRLCRRTAPFLVIAMFAVAALFAFGGQSGRSLEVRASEAGRPLENTERSSHLKPNELKKVRELQISLPAERRQPTITRAGAAGGKKTKTPKKTKGPKKSKSKGKGKGKMKSKGPSMAPKMKSRDLLFKKARELQISLPAERRQPTITRAGAAGGKKTKTPKKTMGPKKSMGKGKGKGKGKMKSMAPKMKSRDLQFRRRQPSVTGRGGKSSNGKKTKGPKKSKGKKTKIPKAAKAKKTKSPKGKKTKSPKGPKGKKTKSPKGKKAKSPKGQKTKSPKGKKSKSPKSKGKGSKTIRLRQLRFV